MKSFELLLSLAILALPACNATTYCNFYDDEHCSVNKGLGISVDNPGCLEENAGRGSIRCGGTNIQNVNLIATNVPGCSCQYQVEPNILGGEGGLLFSWTLGCVNLNQYGIGVANGIQSYRFVGSKASEPHGSCNTCGGALQQSPCVTTNTCPTHCDH